MKRLFRQWLAGLLALVLVLALLPTIVFADGSSTDYIDPTGGNQESKTAEAEAITETSTELTGDKWYVAEGTVSVSERIVVAGQVNLILADGCSLEAEKGITVLDGTP